MKITVLSPHRDDAAFSVGLAIGTWLDAGHGVEVVNCFTVSEYRPLGDVNRFRPGELQANVTALRLEEDLRWSSEYARPVELIDLHLRDAPQRLQCSVDAVCTVAADSGDAAIAEIRTALESRALEALVLPLAIGNHVDHLTARMAAQDGWPSSLPLAFYEDLPYAARPGAAAGIEARANQIAIGLKPSLHKTAECSSRNPTHCRYPRAGPPAQPDRGFRRSFLKAAFVCESADTLAAIKRKRHLVSCYDSQIDTDGMEQISVFCGRYAGRERLWTSRAWLDSGLGIVG